MTNYLLLYFKVHLEGLSKLPQAQVLLQVNKRLLIHCIWESQQLPDSNQLLNFVFYLLILQGSQRGKYLLFLVPLIDLKKMNFFHAYKARFRYLLGILFEFFIWWAPQLFNRVVYPSPLAAFLHHALRTLVTNFTGLSLRAGRCGFPLAAMSMTLGYIHRKWKENRTKRISGMFYSLLWNLKP